MCKGTTKIKDYTIMKKKQFCIYSFRGEYVTRRKLYSQALNYVRELIEYHNNPDNIKIGRE